MPDNEVSTAMLRDTARIDVLGLEDSDDRYGSFLRAEARLHRETISSDYLAAQLEAFFDAIESVVAVVPPTVGDYEVDELTLSLEVSAKGTVSLLGAGGELGGTGGVTISLKRRRITP